MSTLPPMPSAPAPGPPPWAQVAARPPQRWQGFASLLIALSAVGIAIACWFRPAPTASAPTKPPGPTYTEQQITDAKASVCAAHQTVHQAVSLNFGRDRGTDPATQLASAVNARQALVAGSQYLLTTLAEEPATSPELAQAVRTLANTFQKLTVDYLAEVNESEVDSLRHDSDAMTTTIQQLCK